MLFTMFQTDEHAVDIDRAYRRWRFPDRVVGYRSRRCIIAVDRRPGAETPSVHCDPLRGIVVACDGRLTNRDELFDACAMTRHDSVSDSALMCALYARLGDECVTRPTGDFRLVVCDERQHVLLCSVDFVASRRLWWRERGPYVVVASNLGELYDADETLRLDEDYLIERLSSGWNSGRRGPFLGALRLRAGERLRVTHGGATVRKFWCPTMFVAAEAGTRTEEDCLAEFALRLREGVARRLPARGHVLCDLSGGLDSTTITRMAADLCAGSPIQVHAVTASYPGAPRTDERAFAADVAGTAGATHHIVEWGPTEALYRGMPENAFYWDEPIFNVHSHAMALAKHRVLQSIGGDVVLGGAGAEPLLGEYMEWPVFLADDLIRGRWRDLRDGVRRWQCARRAPLLVLLYRACLEPLLRPVAAMSHEARMATPPWLTQRSRRRFATLQAAQLGPTVNRLNTAGAWMAEQWQGAGVSAEQGYGAYAYDTRYPFLYRPLVESVLRMPWSVRVMPRTNKALLRRLAQTLLPAGFASRRSSCADQAASRAMAAQRDRFDGFVRSPALADLGLVDAPRLRASIELAQSGFGRGLRFTVTVLAVELWLRSVLSGDWRRQQLQHLWPREAHVPVSL